MVTHVVVESITYMTEVNARHPDAVDRHVRRAQWSHWSGEKCRSATRHLPVLCVCALSHSLHSIYTYPIRMHPRWQELCKVVRYCNDVQQFHDL